MAAWNLALADIVRQREAGQIRDYDPSNPPTRLAALAKESKERKAAAGRSNSTASNLKRAETHVKKLNGAAEKPPSLEEAVAAGLIGRDKLQAAYDKAAALAYIPKFEDDPLMNMLGAYKGANTVKTKKRQNGNVDHRAVASIYQHIPNGKDLRYPSVLAYKLRRLIECLDQGKSPLELDPNHDEWDGLERVASGWTRRP